ncbi:MAG: 30S ribosomal protein S3, partial [Selenomonadaceae bacterium]|nr:30S ribosomal protein S3 [Selenomonadaceae bacterium]
PHGIRLGIVKTWDAKWYAGKDFATNLHEDIKIRKAIKTDKQLSTAGVSRIEIERSEKRLKLTIHTAKPGMVIGRGGAGIEDIKNKLKKLTDKRVDINIMEIRQPDLDALLVAENIASQLERRIAFRRAMKQSVGRTMRLGAKGIKIACSGRLGGAEIARSESYREGSIPLHTLRADIDYGFAEANTTYGRIGIKVWIFKGEILPDKKDKIRQSEGSDD